eukprot:4645094-Amphidinium_carterae.1
MLMAFSERPKAAKRSETLLLVAPALRFGSMLCAILHIAQLVRPAIRPKYGTPGHNSNSNVPKRFPGPLRINMQAAINYTCRFFLRSAKNIPLKHKPLPARGQFPRPPLASISF